MTSTLKVGVVSDIHVAPAGSAPDAWHNPYDFEGTEGRLAAALALFTQEPVDAVFLLGDVVHFGDMPSFERVERLLAACPVPTYIAPGNHDALVALPAFVTNQSADSRIALVTPAKVDGVWASEAAEFNDDALIVLSHFPLVSRRAEVTARGLKYAGDLSDQPELLARLHARPGPTIVFSGHLHVRDTAADGPVLQLIFPAVIEHPFECAIVELDGNELRRRAIALHHAPADNDPLLTSERETWRYDERAASSGVMWEQET